VDERQSFFEDDDNDTLLFEKLQEHVLENTLTLIALAASTTSS